VIREGLLVDCDPGHDDVLAILTAARYGELVGITTVAGMPKRRAAIATPWP